MATYITLCNFTEKGAHDIKDSLNRTEAAKAAAKQFGATIKEVLWLQGKYDLIVIFEATDEIAMTAFLLNTIKAGNIRGQTLRAFTAGVVNWTQREDIQNEMRNDLDDYLFDVMRDQKGVPLTPAIMDNIIDRILSIARARLPD